MKLLDAISCLIFLVLFSLAASAQESISHQLGIDIPEVALLALQSENTTDVNLSALPPNTAGQQIKTNKEEQSGIWINYSSVVRKNQKRKVTATVVGEIPEGMVLKVMASESRGEGKGKLGESLSWVALRNGSVDVISDIGSCYTGRGAQNGHLLTYKIELDDDADQYAKLKQSETSLQILYTLTDDN
ncbi:hypothetical protein [Draconibacterium sediminis]|uniref:Uncharacterized protein n=1 Tax=Draconibacterium sediminis TaxID=1544798 RepID=A0A0D8JF69_9BACT|nr:hypothetical protein [Draconibacterium sediminis]KJF44498.1 hypothetical protein LH29_03145 [Draconibacterium sediminis]